MGLILRLKSFVSNGLFVASWKTFMSCGSVKGGEEYMGSDGYGLKLMDGELEES